MALNQNFNTDKNIKKRTLMNSSQFAQTVFNGQNELVEELLKDILSIPELEVIDVSSGLNTEFLELGYVGLDNTTNDDTIFVELKFQKPEIEHGLDNLSEYESLQALVKLPTNYKEAELSKLVEIYFTDFDVSNMNIPFFRLGTQLTSMVNSESYAINPIETAWKESIKYYLNIDALKEDEYSQYPIGKWAKDLTESDYSNFNSHLLKERIDFLDQTERGRIELLALDSGIRKKSDIESFIEGYEEGFLNGRQSILNRFYKLLEQGKKLKDIKVLLGTFEDIN